MVIQVVNIAIAHVTIIGAIRATSKLRSGPLSLCNEVGRRRHHQHQPQQTVKGCHFDLQVPGCADVLAERGMGDGGTMGVSHYDDVHPSESANYGADQWESSEKNQCSASHSRPPSHGAFQVQPKNKRLADSPIPEERSSQTLRKGSRVSPDDRKSLPSSRTAPQSASLKATALPPRCSHPPLSGCLSVYRFQQLNRIQEGSYGVVYRARDRQSRELVALKKIKLDQHDGNGFPITSLREIRTLTESIHPNVVQLREVAVGERLSQIYLVMEFVEHDLYTLLRRIRTPFLLSEIKTMTRQLLSALVTVHHNWFIHRDIKTSNVLMNNHGQIKLADFGLARQFSDPPPEHGLTLEVVSLWYRAPELLLGATEYDTAIDVWSVGCVLGELLLREPLFAGSNPTDQTLRIFRLLGTPTQSSWPGFTRLAHANRIAPQTPAHIGGLRNKFLSHLLSDQGLDLLKGLLAYDSTQRPTAEEALQHPWFRESPLPAHPDTFGSFPSAAAGDQ